MNKCRKFSPQFKADRAFEILTAQISQPEEHRMHQPSPQQVNDWKTELIANAAVIF